MDRGHVGEDAADETDDRGSRSILGLESLRPAERPETPPPSPLRAAPRPPSAPPFSRSFLHLEEDAPRPFAPPTSAEPVRTGNGFRPTRSFLDLDSDSARPIALSGGGAPAARPARPGGSVAEEGLVSGRSVLGLPSGVEPMLGRASSGMPFVSAARGPKAFAHAPVGASLARPRESVPLPDPSQTLFVELERRPDRAFPVERAILISLVLHFLLVLLVGTVRYGSGEVHPGLLAALRPPPKPAENEIPIIFHEAPGPERANPRRSDFSDKNRIAGGGDRTKPKSETPFIPELPGKQGLTPGAGRTAEARRPAGTETGRGSRPDAGSRSPSTAERQPEVLAEERPGPSESYRPPAGGSAPGTQPGAPPRGLPDLTTVIQREAQNSLSRGSGENGAGIPNPDGGFVDSGPISFETSWYDWGAYAEEMVRRIKLHWDIPKLAELGWKGKLTIHFNIRLDGSVEGATLVSGSGVPPFDFAAMQAILKSNPFRPLPKDLIKLVPGKTKEGITVTFFYNLRPDREGRSEAPR